MADQGAPATVDQKRFQKLLAEYQKVKAKNSVLKRGVLEAQKENEELQAQLVEKEKQMRAQMAETNQKDFHIQRLTKRCDKLKSQLDASQRSDKPDAQSSWLPWPKSGKSPEMEKMEKDMDVVREELQLQIEMNQKVHTQLFSLKSEHKKTVETLQVKLTDYKEQVHVLQEDLERSQKQVTGLKDEIAVQQKTMQSEIQTLVKKLDDAHREMKDREQSVITMNQQIHVELRELQTRYRSKVIFDDSTKSTYNMWSLPTYSREDVQHKAALVDDLRMTFTGLKTHCKSLMNHLLERIKCSSEKPRASDQLVVELASLPTETERCFDAFTESLSDVHEVLIQQTELGGAPAGAVVSSPFERLASLLDALGRFLCVNNDVFEAEKSQFSRMDEVYVGHFIDAARGVHALLQNAVQVLAQLNNLQPASIIPTYANWVTLTLLTHKPTLLTKIRRGVTNLSSRFAAIVSSTNKSSRTVSPQLRQANASIVQDMTNIAGLITRVVDRITSFQSTVSVAGRTDTAAAAQTRPVNGKESPAGDISVLDAVQAPHGDATVLATMHSNTRTYLSTVSSDPAFTNSEGSVPYEQALQNQAVLTSKLKELDDTKADLDAAVEDLTALEEERAAEQARQAEEVQARDKTIKRLQNRVTALTKKVAMYEEDCQELQEELQEQEAECMELRRKLAAGVVEPQAAKDAPSGAIASSPRDEQDTSKSDSSPKDEPTRTESSESLPPSNHAEADAGSEDEDEDLLSMGNQLLSPTSREILPTLKSLVRAASNAEQKSTTRPRSPANPSTAAQRKSGSKSFYVIKGALVRGAGLALPRAVQHSSTQKWRAFAESSTTKDTAGSVLSLRMAEVERDSYQMELAQMRQELLAVNQKTVQLHLKLKRLGRTLDETHTLHQAAKQAADKATKKWHKLEEDLKATKENYDKMLNELTEHLCQLTEKLAQADARKQPSSGRRGSRARY